MRRDQILAYNIAALGVSFFSCGVSGKRLPDFSECFSDAAEAETMDASAMAERIIAINRMLGGDVRYQSEDDLNACS